MQQFLKFLILSTLFFAAFSKDYFLEQFDDESYAKRWIYSEAKSDLGKFKHSHGKFYGDATRDLGLQTSQDAHFYGISAKFNEFSNEGKTLVIQFSVKHEQKIDCGGGYIKVFPSSLDQSKLTGDSPYHIMFGPDICGYGTKKVHVIFTYKGKNFLIKKEITCKDDEFTHLYTLILRPDNTYEVRIDTEKVQDGKLEEDWDFLPPKRIPDPNAKKPSDWVENPKMDDPDDKKPEDWDKPQHIPDPEAKKPTDWDDEIDGTWEPPLIDNPAYKGVWKAKQINNPAYKGPWIHPQIDNPEYVDDTNLYLYKDIGAVGFDLWQVKSGTIFDNILITDDVERAEQVAKETWQMTKYAEKVMKDKLDEAEKYQENKEQKTGEAEDAKATTNSEKKESHILDDEL